MTTRQKKRRKIYVSVFLLGLIFYFLALLWLLPAWIKAPINEQLKKMDLQIDYQRLWINPLTLNIHVTNPNVQNLSNQTLLTAEKVDVDWQLLPLLNRQIVLDKIQLKQADIALEFNQNNQLISPALATTNTDNTSQWQLQAGQIEVTDSSVTIKRQNQSLPIKNINLKLNLSEIKNPDQTFHIRFETNPQGDFIIRQQVDGTFHWQINSWPIQPLSPWISNNENDAELAGQLTAAGSLNWPNNQLPIVDVDEMSLNIEHIRWFPYRVEKTPISAQDIKLNFNTNELSIGQITSTDGQLTIHTDPLNLADTQSEMNTTNNPWSAKLNTLELANWQINLQENRPAVKARIKQLSLHQTGTQQDVFFNAEIYEPFNQLIQVTGQGLLDPFQIQGQIKTENLALEALNPWLNDLSPWQIQQATLSVNSQFCAQSNGVIAQGYWSLPKLSVRNDSQRIDATQTNLHAIGLYFNQKKLTLNYIKNQSLELYQPTTHANIQTVENTNSTPQSTEQLWRVVIDEETNQICLIKPL